MAQDNSFDVVSEYDQQELMNALDQARREIGTRYDFKGITADIEYEKDEIVITTAGDMQLKAIIDLLKGKMHKRGLDMRIIDPQKVEDASKGNVRQTLKLRKGIGDELGKKISKRIRDDFPKAQVRIQGDQLRVSAKDRDLLQAVIGSLRDADDLEVPLQFTNYR